MAALMASSARTEQWIFTGGHHSFVTPARYSGWVVVRNATDNTITLFCDPEDETTATIYAARGIAGADEHNRTRLRRAMAAWQISYEASKGLISKASAKIITKSVGWSTTHIVVEGTIVKGSTCVVIRNGSRRLVIGKASIASGGNVTTVSGDGSNGLLLTATTEGTASSPSTQTTAMTPAMTAGTVETIGNGSGHAEGWKIIKNYEQYS